MRAGTRAALCVYVPYVLSATLEFLRAGCAVSVGVHVSLLRDMVQCVGSRLLSCPVAWIFCGRGAALAAASRDSTPPSPKGAATSEPPHHGHSEKESQTFSLIPLSDSVDRDGSGLSVHARAVSGALAVENNQPSSSN